VKGPYSWTSLSKPPRPHHQKPKPRSTRPHHRPARDQRSSPPRKASWTIRGEEDRRPCRRKLVRSLSPLPSVAGRESLRGGVGFVSYAKGECCFSFHRFYLLLQSKEYFIYASQSPKHAMQRMSQTIG
jgi:hypothetical protein